MFKSFVLTFTLLFALPSYANQTLVLIHGYLGDGSAWRYTGISAALHYNGWQDGGHLLPYGGQLFTTASPIPGGRYHYTISLPSEAPLMLQTQHLLGYLYLLQQRHPENNIVLIGHSAGGVVARLAMVLQPNLPIQGLITIAAPHLGTELAQAGLAAAQSPLAWITPLMGLSTLNRSIGLYADLQPEHPGSLLFWLNRQPHPRDALYFAIIRGTDPSISSDGLVPAFSQDLNQVPVLRGQAQIWPSLGSHALQPADAGLIVRSLLLLSQADQT